MHADLDIADQEFGFHEFILLLHCFAIIKRVPGLVVGMVAKTTFCHLDGVLAAADEMTYGKAILSRKSRA